jgi:RNA polymerase sigma-70 factor (ECF subfamily)
MWVVPRVAVSLQNGTHECAPVLARRIGRSVIPARRRAAADGTSAPAETVAGDAATDDAAPDDAAPDDAVLAERSVTDPEAFGVLYDRYCGRIYHFVYRRLGDVSAAEDVTAEVFFKALKAINSYRSAIAPFPAWLHRIAANAVVDHLRRQRPTVSLDGAPATLDTPDPAVPVDEQAIDRMEAARVWRAVDALPEAQRTAVVLRHGGDLPIADIAARMSRTEGAVKLLLNRGLATVREQLRDAVHDREGQP